MSETSKTLSEKLNLKFNFGDLIVSLTTTYYIFNSKDTWYEIATGLIFYSICRIILSLYCIYKSDETVSETWRIALLQSRIEDLERENESRKAVGEVQKAKRSRGRPRKVKTQDPPEIQNISLAQFDASL